jgi:hypothetical protein
MTRLTGIDCVYFANKITGTPGKQAAFSFGVGVIGQELIDVTQKSGMTTVTAATSDASVAGGYAQMAGHAALSATYGLAADNILEWHVVTADGSLVIANARVNPDLYNALRGGGGGTFGVVVQATMKVYPTPQLQVTRYWLKVASPNDTFSVFEPAAYLHRQLPSLSKRGIQGYYFIMPHGIFIALHKPNSNEAEAKRVWQPIFKALEAFPGMEKKSIVQWKSYATYKDYFDAGFGKLAPYEAGQPPFNDFPAPRGIGLMDSWLMSEKSLEHPRLAQALRQAMPFNLDTGMLRGHLVSGGKVHDPNMARTTNVNPAWRSALTHLIATGGGGIPNMTSIKQLEPGAGNYGNEDLGTVEPDWKNHLWGEKYERLYNAKRRWDPNGIFWVTPGVGADDYAIFHGRLCKVSMLRGSGYIRPPNPMNYAPLFDNANPSRGPQTDYPFPATQEQADSVP